jgi:hypothetical protein
LVGHGDSWKIRTDTADEGRHLEAEQRQRQEKERLEAEEHQRQEKERLASERRSEESLKLLRWGGENAVETKFGKLADSTTRRTLKQRDGLFRWTSKYHYIFPLVGVLGYIFAALSSGEFNNFDFYDSKFYLPIYHQYRSFSG